ncbi:hypothetical protein ACOSQ2_019397 [Xanthoceras sorbifolium]
MAKKKIGSYVEFLLKLINSIFFLFALAALFYSLYFFFKWKHYASMKPQSHKPKQEPPARLLLAFGASKWLFEELPSPWFVYFTMAISALLIFISCFGYIGSTIRSPCCLCFVSFINQHYSVILVGFILAELGIGALVLFGRDSKKDLPRDKTGTLLSTYQFLNQKWKIIRWVALAIHTLEVIALFLAMYLRCGYRGSNDRDREESIIRADSLRRAAARRSNTRTAAPPPTGGRVLQTTSPKKTPS